MTWLPRIVGTPMIPMTGGLLAGLAAAYGRELSLRRRPDWRWWLSQVLLLPAAAIISVVIDEGFTLPGEIGMLVALLTVMRGYDGLAMIRGEKQAVALARAPSRLEVSR